MNQEIIINRVAKSKNPILRYLVFLLCCAFFVSTSNA